MSSAITTTITTSTTKSLLRLKHWLCGWRKQWDEGGTWFRSGVVSLCWNVSGNPRWQIGPQIRYLAAVAFKIRNPINLMAESAEVSVHEVDSQQIVSFSLHRELFDAIFSIHKWTQFDLTLNMFVSIPRGDLDGALFWETTRSRCEIPMVKMSLPGY